MKYIGFRDTSSQERHIGAVDAAGVHDLGEVSHFYAAVAAGHAPVAAAEPVPLEHLEQEPPVPETSRIFCVGINYYDHADEAKTGGIDLPKFPMVFGRWAQSLSVSGAEVAVPPREKGLDWEVELAVVIGRPTWAAAREDALDSVFGYTAFNDLSARDKQRQTLQFTLGKNADGSGPIGPVLVSADSLPPGGAGLRVQARVNGQVMQDATTTDLIHDVAAIIEYITDTVTLLPGDVIATGTPGGVGFARTPPILLDAGDEVEVEVEGIGTIRTPIVRR